jgi:hypothetical protein
MLDLMHLPDRNQDRLRRQPEQERGHETGPQKRDELSGARKHGRLFSCSIYSNAAGASLRPYLGGMGCDWRCPQQVGSGHHPNDQLPSCRLIT